MRVLPSITLALLMSTGALTVAAPGAAHAYTSVDFRVGFAPPPLPTYYQPESPGYGYIWTPGYWAWDDDQGNYYWVDGQWVQPPQVGYLWTPGYWGYDSGDYIFNQGYWGPQVGYYGGVNYGYGYGGYGYDGGYWRGRNFFYNREANNFRRWDFDRDYDRPLDHDWRHHDHDNDRRSFGDERDRGHRWNRGADGRVNDHNRDGAPVQGQQGWNRDTGGVVVQPQQGWTRGANGVVVRPEQGQFNGRQSYPPANGGGFDRSGQRQRGAGADPVTAPTIWRGADRGAPNAPPNYRGPRQTYAPQADFMGRPQGGQGQQPPRQNFQGQQPPRQTFQSQPPRQTFAAPQPQRQAQPAQRSAPPAQGLTGHTREDYRQ